MRFISRRFHASFDYVTGLLLLLTPWIFNFDDIEAARWSAVAAGALILVMAVLTNYYGEGSRLTSMRTHLTIDVITGLFVAAAPWLFNFAEIVYLPHLVLGLLLIEAGLFTERSALRPQAHRVDHMRHA